MCISPTRSYDGSVQLLRLESCRSNARWWGKLRCLPNQCGTRAVKSLFTPPDVAAPTENVTLTSNTHSYIQYIRVHTGVNAYRVRARFGHALGHLKLLRHQVFSLSSFSGARRCVTRSIPGARQASVARVRDAQSRKTVSIPRGCPSRQKDLAIQY